MPLGSFVSGALATLTVDDLDRMLKLDETLFVEHKSDLKTDGSYNLMKAVASFANTLGGWLLIGVHAGKPIDDPGSWSNASGPPLVDQVRDRLRHELDPLPAFEARVLPHPDGPIGVVRVYQSADTPHVAIKTGSVFVREVAGDSDASRPRRAGGGRDSERAYAAAQIRSRAQLIELTERGKLAEQRVRGLVDPLRPLPLTNNALDLRFEHAAEDTIQPKPIAGGGVVVRLVPYSLPPHFQGWSTTADASTAVLTAVEGLADRHGLAGDWITPHPAGQSVDVPLEKGRRLLDASGLGLDASARAVLDGAGVAGAALWHESPGSERRRHLRFNDVAEQLVAPTIEAAATALTAGEIIGRAWCQIDLVGLGRVLLLEKQGDEASGWVPSGGDVTLPLEASELHAHALRAAYAFARSAGLPAWDPPASNI